MPAVTLLEIPVRFLVVRIDQLVMIEASFLIHETCAVAPPLVLSEADRVVSWRICQLTLAGYDEQEAVILACAHGVDLHRALDLRAEGCSGATALRILL